MIFGSLLTENQLNFVPVWFVVCVGEWARIILGSKNMEVNITTSAANEQRRMTYEERRI